MLVFPSLSYVQLYYCHLIIILELITLFVLFHSPVLSLQQKLAEKTTVLLCAMGLTTYQIFMLFNNNWASYEHNSWRCENRIVNVLI